MARSEPPRRIVCIRPGALGDTLLTLPALALLRRQWPSAELAFVARGDVLPLASESGLAHRTSAYDLPAWSALFAEHPANLAPTRDPLLALLAGSATIAWLRDDDRQVARNLSLLGASPVQIAPAAPRVDAPQHMALTLACGLAPLGVPLPPSVEALRQILPPLHTPPADQSVADEFWRSLRLADDAPVIALHPGSGGSAKRWPAASFATLARLLIQRGAHPLLIEGPQDAGVTQAVLAALGEHATNLPVARTLSIATLAALFPRCAAYVGNDSGVTHLAALTGTLTIALFGPTDPALWSPLGERVRVIQAAHGHIEEITPDEVAGALR